MADQPQSIRTGLTASSWAARWWTGPEELFEERRWCTDDRYKTLRRTTSRVMHLFPPGTNTALCGVECDPETWGATVGGVKGLRCEECVEREDQR